MRKSRIEKSFLETRYYNMSFPYIGAEQFMLSFGLALSSYKELKKYEVLNKIESELRRGMKNKTDRIMRRGEINQYDSEGVSKCGSIIKEIFDKEELRKENGIDIFIEVFMELLRKEEGEFSDTEISKLIEWIEEGYNIASSDYWNK